jgi:hypothetical protein
MWRVVVLAGFLAAAILLAGLSPPSARAASTPENCSYSSPPCVKYCYVTQEAPNQYPCGVQLPAPSSLPRPGDCMSSPSGQTCANYCPNAQTDAYYPCSVSNIPPPTQTPSVKAADCATASPGQTCVKFCYVADSNRQYPCGVQNIPSAPEPSTNCGTAADGQFCVKWCYVAVGERDRQYPCGIDNLPPPILPDAIGPPPQSDITQGLLACTLPTEATNFDVYWLGDSFEGLPKVAVTRKCDLPNVFDSLHHRANYVSIVYGDCTATDDMPCQPPLEIQSWPACERGLSSYTLTPFGDAYDYTAQTIAGVPGATFNDGDGRTEVYTGGSTVVLFGTDSGQVLRAAAAIERLAPVPLPAALQVPSLPGPLPQPLDGALAGTLPCV